MARKVLNITQIHIETLWYVNIISSFEKTYCFNLYERQFYQVRLTQDFCYCHYVKVKYVLNLCI